MKIGLVGLGHWGKNHARILGNMKKEGIIGNLYFCDLIKERLNSLSKQYGAAPVTDFEELLSKDLDAVSIVVPADIHYEVAKPFIEAGIKVFIEKPFTDSVKSSEELIEISSDPEKQIMVGHIFRFHPAINLALDTINEGQIGEIKRIDIRRLAYRIPRRDNGVIFSLAVHDLDLLLFFIKDRSVKKINSLVSSIYGPTEDHAFIQLLFENNIIGTIEESWMSPTTGKIRTMMIQGNSGVIDLDFSVANEIRLSDIYIEKIGKTEQIRNNGTRVITTEYSEPLKLEINHFLNSVREDRKFLVNALDGLKVGQLCQSILLNS